MPDNAACRVVITLVHGTWASDAAWTRPSSQLCGYLRKELSAEVEFRCFAWTPLNTHKHRLEAAQLLRKAIRAEIGERHLTKHFLIAHSHGGNVALYAMHDEDVSTAVDGVICLATPFLHIQRSRLPRSLLWAATLFLCSCIVIAVVYLVQMPKNAAGMYLAVGITALFMVVLAIAFRALFPRRGSRLRAQDLFAVARDPNEFVRRLSFPSLPPDRFVAIRVSGDEAAGLLAASQFFTWLFRSAWAALAPAWEIFDRFRSRLMRFLALTMAGAIVAASLAPAAAGVSDAVKGAILLVMTAFGIVAFFVGFVSFLLAALLFLAHIPFGIDTVVSSLELETTAEASPPGCSTVFHVEANGVSELAQRALKHSRIYDDPQVIRFIADWIHVRLRTDRGPDPLEKAAGTRP